MKNKVAVIAAILLLFGCACAQVSRPAFCGTRKLIPRLSKFGPYTFHDAVDTFKLELADSKLKIVHVLDDRSKTSVLVLDGKERYIGNALDKTTANAHWDGDTIVTEMRQELESGSVWPTRSVWTTRYSLSSDGKQLTISRRVLKSAISPQFDEEFVYQRQ